MSRPGVSYKKVGAAFFGLLVVGLAIGFGIYVKYVRYDRVASRHLPRDTTAALRIDVEKVQWFEPMREHFLPLMDTLGAGTNKRSRHDRIKGKTGFEPAVDLREVVVARGEAPGTWLVVLGGLFPRTGLVQAIGEALRDDGRGGEARDGLWQDSSGICLGQAEDGVLLLGASCERVSAALSPTDAAERLGLGRQGPVSFAARGATARAAVAALGGQVPAGLEALNGAAESGEPIHWRVEVSDAAGGSEALAKGLAGGWGRGEDRWTIREIGPAPQAEGAHLRAAWSRVQVKQLAGVLADAVRRAAEAPTAAR